MMTYNDKSAQCIKPVSLSACVGTVTDSAPTNYTLLYHVKCSNIAVVSLAQQGSNFVYFYSLANFLPNLLPASKNTTTKPLFINYSCASQQLGLMWHIIYNAHEHVWAAPGSLTV